MAMKTLSCSSEKSVDELGREAGQDGREGSRRRG